MYGVFYNRMEREIDQSIMDEDVNVSMIDIIYLDPKWSSNDLSFSFSLSITYMCIFGITMVDLLSLIILTSIHKTIKEWLLIALGLQI